jgi:hypothetical protein
MNYIVRVTTLQFFQTLDTIFLLCNIICHQYGFKVRLLYKIQIYKYSLNFFFLLSIHSQFISSEDGFVMNKAEHLNLAVQVNGKKPVKCVTRFIPNKERSLIECLVFCSFTGGEDSVPLISCHSICCSEIEIWFG